MFGRQIFLDSMANQQQQRRRNELLRQFLENQRHETPFTELAIPSLRNDGLTLDLNFILLEDADRVQPNEMCLRTNSSNRHLLEYIRQMEERYIAMEKELTRTKMLIPTIPRNTKVIHQMSQTDIDWEKFSLVNKYLSGSPLGNQCKKNEEKTNVSFRRKNHSTKKNKDSNGKTFGDIDWTKNKSFSQNPQNDVYPIKEDSVNRLNLICDKASVEVCQRLDKKHEPETSSHTGFDVKHEDHTQAGCTVNTAEFRPIMGPKFSNDVPERKSEMYQSTSNRSSNIRYEERNTLKRMKIFENPNLHRKENSHVGQTYQSNRNHWNNPWKKLSYERTRAVNDPARNFTRLVQKQRKETHKNVPTPRSNVHTAYTPMVQPSTWNPMLDTNGFTIQLLRLAVLLYAPALMPALNSLIARQNAQTSIPIPCTEGSNDLLTQVFTILNNQQSVPNLPYVSSTRTEENTQFPVESTSRNSPSNSENIGKEVEEESCDTRKEFEKNTIAVNTSLEMCTCANANKSSPECSQSTLHEQPEVDEENPVKI
ncbi:uncharacterized protein LOC117610064 [Osmia lignaria lignaria]|uniref:uncharacterized protein LOC117610064 n=1 Tax=Osmia lignaria lignaria TaxID=1437193 RepID=UPI00402BA3EC